MFRLYRPDNYERGPISTPVDGTDAQRIHKGMSHPSFPQKHRIALNWFYVRPVNPGKVARELGLSLEGLSEYVNEGRTMLVNRRV